MKFSKSQNLIGKFRQWLISLKSPGIVFGNNIYIGKNCAISRIYNLTFGSDIYIGKNVTIEAECDIRSGVLIGNNVGIVGRRDHDVFGNNTPAFFARTVREDRALSSRTLIDEGSWIGFGAVILSGVVIGKNSIVGAGSVVRYSVPENSIVAGNPARVVGYRTQMQPSSASPLKP